MGITYDSQFPNILIAGDLDFTGRPGLSGPALTEYNEKVTKGLDKIKATTTGRTIMGQIAKKSGKVLSIRPSPIHCQAMATPISFNFTPATPADQQPLVCVPNSQGLAPGTPVPGLPAGTGTGANAMVPFTPAEWEPGSASCVKRGDIGNKPDETLFHEMVHALRIMAGKWLCIAVGAKYTNEEEFFAVLLSNVYLSEKANGGDTPLRADHEGFKPLVLRTNDQNKEFADTVISGEKNMDRIKKFHDQMGFGYSLAWVNAKFNPFFLLL